MLRPYIDDSLEYDDRDFLQIYNNVLSLAGSRTAVKHLGAAQAALKPWNLATISRTLYRSGLLKQRLR